MSVELAWEAIREARLTSALGEKAADLQYVLDELWASPLPSPSVEFFGVAEGQAVRILPRLQYQDQPFDPGYFGLVDVEDNVWFAVVLPGRSDRAAEFARWSTVRELAEGVHFGSIERRTISGRLVVCAPVVGPDGDDPIAACLSLIRRLVEETVYFDPTIEPRHLVLGSAPGPGGADSGKERAALSQQMGSAWWETSFPWSESSSFERDLEAGVFSVAFIYGRTGLPDWRARILQASDSLTSGDDKLRVKGATKTEAAPGNLALRLSDFEPQRVPWGRLIKISTGEPIGRPSGSFTRSYVYSGRVAEHQLANFLDRAKVKADVRPETKVPVPSPIADLVKQHKNVVIEGVAGSGKSHQFGELIEHFGRVELVVFHPSTSYEEFVAGLRPVGDTFETVPGAFVRLADYAFQNPSTDVLLFVDEINRANTSRVMGDLLLPIEATKRVGRETLERLHGAGLADSAVLTDSQLARAREVSPGLISVRLQTPLSGDRYHLVVPDNLHILGTMNSTDRSVGTIDLALRRRFYWHTVEPLSGMSLVDALEQAGVPGSRLTALGPLVNWHQQANDTLASLVGPDARLGHSYFFGDSALEHVSRALASQLAEISGAFGVSEEVMTRIFPDGQPLPGGLIVDYQGARLGRRAVVVEVGRLHAGQGERNGESVQAPDVAAPGR